MLLKPVTQSWCPVTTALSQLTPGHPGPPTGLASAQGSSNLTWSTRPLPLLHMPHTPLTSSHLLLHSLFCCSPRPLSMTSVLDLFPAPQNPPSSGVISLHQRYHFLLTQGILTGLHLIIFSRFTAEHLEDRVSVIFQV